jgi:hypothetical protein
MPGSFSLGILLVGCGLGSFSLSHPFLTWGPSTGLRLGSSSLSHLVMLPGLPDSPVELPGSSSLGVLFLFNFSSNRGETSIFVQHDKFL